MCHPAEARVSDRIAALVQGPTRPHLTVDDALALGALERWARLGRALTHRQYARLFEIELRAWAVVSGSVPFPNELRGRPARVLARPPVGAALAGQTSGV